MRPVRVSQTIDAPRERVYELLADVSSYSEFFDHYLGELRLERLDSKGLGASLSFQLRFPLWRVRGDMVLTRAEAPHSIVANGRIGRIGRIPVELSFELTVGGQAMTRVQFVYSSAPSHAVDRCREMLGMRTWTKLQARRALRRLAALIEGRASTVTEPVSAAAG